MQVISLLFNATQLMFFTTKNYLLYIVYKLRLYKKILYKNNKFATYQAFLFYLIYIYLNISGCYPPRDSVLVSRRNSQAGEGRNGASVRTTSMRYHGEDTEIRRGCQNIFKTR